MSDKKKKITLDGFPGGLFSAANSMDALPTQLLQCENAMTNERGAILPRFGVTAGGLEYAERIIDVIAASGASANERYMTLNDKTLIDPVEVVLHTYSVAAKGKFLFFNGRYSHTNGVDAMQTWTSGAAATANALGAPLSRVLHVHNNRVFCANGQTLYETAPGAGPDPAVDNFATGATWAIITTDADPIFAVASLGRDLYIFKSKSIHLQTGFTVNERQTRQFSDKHGCTTIESVRTVWMEGIGEAVIFLSSERKLCAIFGGDVHEIGEPVEDILQTVSISVGALEKFPANANMLEARAVYNPRTHLYMLGFATAAGGLPSTYTQCLVLNLKYPYKSQYGTRWPFYLWKQTADAGTFPIQFGAMYWDELIYPKNVGCGMTSPLATYKLYVFNDSITTDDGYSIKPTITTNNHDAGKNQDFKQWTDVIFHFSKTSAAAIQYIYTQTNDEEDTPILNSSQSFTATKANVIYEIPGPLYNDARRCSIQVKFSAAGQKLHKIELQYLKGAVI